MSGIDVMRLNAKWSGWVGVGVVALVGVVGDASVMAGEAGLPVTPPGEFFPLKAADHDGAASFRHGQPILGTSYFYWYDIDSKAHIINGDGTDALTTHPADLETISYKRADWHEGQLRDMVVAGIDFLMPVYWGVPGKYDGWSFAGLPPLVAAHDALEKAGLKPPAIGLFYDTSILQYNGFNRDGSSLHVDLSTEVGKTYFYTALRDFFSLIPPAKWARVDGKPIVFLYAAAFAKKQDAGQFEDLRRRFRKDFGTDLFLVKMRGWQGEADATYQWGGAVHLYVDPEVAAVGPGYDHSAVPGRSRLVVDRRDGKTYSDRWNRLLRMDPQRRPWMVHVETWNEWHEGTDVAASREYGRSYIMLTGVFSSMWHGGVRLSASGPYAAAKEVFWEPGRSGGITIRPSSGDGEWKVGQVAGKSAAVAQANAVSPGRYLYFDVDDIFAYDLDGATMEIEVTYADGGCESFGVEYDNADPTMGAVDGAFRQGGAVKIGGTGAWKTATISMEQCRFINRCNAADFRLVAMGGEMELTVGRVTVRKR